MKRRNFIKKAGAGASAMGVLPALADVKPRRHLPNYQYPKAEKLSDIKNDEGHVTLRIAFSSDNPYNTNQFAAVLRIKKGQLNRTRTLGYVDTSREGTFMFSPTNGEMQVLALWIANATDETTVSLNAENGAFELSLADVVKQNEMQGTVAGLDWRANFLMYHEIGELNPADVGISTESDDFAFVAMADPQGGDPFEGKDILKTRMRIHNAFIEESVDLITRLNIDPKFTMVIGDVTDDWGAEEDFQQMNDFLQKSGTPLLYSIGNHETLLRSVFTPGYNMDAFDNYFAAQKAINGLELLLYSYNLGQWHFVVWPDPLRPGFWETHPHYFDWLERDLAKHKDRPTMIFQHVPIHPMGIVPLIDYAESVAVKRELIDIFSRHGAVRYVLSGHVHIPVKASFKTAVEINGIQFINLPAAGYRPRAFGESDYHGGPSQGIAIVEIHGDQADITVKTVTEEEYGYPKSLRKFDKERYPLWLGEDWELPLNEGLVNGDFSDNLQGWHRRFVYTEDENPCNVCRTVMLEGKPTLYLYNRKRGYVTPGQDRLPQDINKVFQMVQVAAHDLPTLTMRYLIEAGSDLGNFTGAYVWVAANSGRTRHFNLVYSINPVWANLGGRQETRRVDAIDIDLTGEPRGWNDVRLNIAADFDRFQSDRSYSDLNIDRLLIKLGVWNTNDGDEKPFGIYFSDLQLTRRSTGDSHLNGQPLKAKDNADRWWRSKLVRNANIAGEHRYTLDTAVRFTAKK